VSRTFHWCQSLRIQVHRDSGVCVPHQFLRGFGGLIAGGEKGCQSTAKRVPTYLLGDVQSFGDKHLRDLTVAREQREAKQEQGAREYATLLLRAHFAEDRNEFLSADDIRSWYK